MFTERQAIKEEMEWIREERRLLTERYQTLQARLGELDKLAFLEVAQTSEVLFELTGIIDKVTNLIPHVPISAMVEKLPNIPLVDDSKPPTPPDLIRMISQQKIHDEQNAPVKRRNKENLQDVGLKVIALMKDVGRPMKMKEIKVAMKERYDIEWSNPTNSMNNIMKYYPKLQKLDSYGMYQLKL